MKDLRNAKKKPISKWLLCYGKNELEKRRETICKSDKSWTIISSWPEHELEILNFPSTFYIFTSLPKKFRFSA